MAAKKAKTKTKDLTRVAPEDRSDVEMQEAFERWRKYTGRYKRSDATAHCQGRSAGERSGEASLEPLIPYLHGMSSVMEDVGPA